MNFKNYDATLSNYNIGDVYSFYVHNVNSEILIKAEEELVNKYSSIISELSNNTTNSEKDKNYLTLTHVVGVIVDKHEATDSRDIDRITVMFKAKDDNFVLNEYIVNSQNLVTIKNNNVPVVAVL